VTDARINGDGVIRVVIADDHALFRHGIEQALAGEHDIDVIGEASDGVAATEQVLTLAPDVVLMDVRMPGLSGVEAAERIHAERPEVRIVMLTGSQNEEDLFAAVRAGATAYVLKEASVEELTDAVRAAHRGDGAVAPSMVPKLFREFLSLSRRCGEEASLASEPQLTEREIEVLRLVAKGMSNKEIAADLVIAQNTAKNHVRNILEKLRMRSRTEAAMYAVREGLVAPQ
jgi:DNA-binding NarL/FixJ family response regulator